MPSFISTSANSNIYDGWMENVFYNTYFLVQNMQALEIQKQFLKEFEFSRGNSQWYFLVGAV